MFEKRFKNHGLTILCLFALAATTVACAKPQSRLNWQNPNVAKEEWSFDAGDCRRFARREVERKIGPAAASAPIDNFGGGAGTYNTSMSRYELSRFEERTFASCMRSKGYAPIAP